MIDYNIEVHLVIRQSAYDHNKYLNMAINLVNKKNRVILKFATAAALIVTGSICTSLKPDDLVRLSVKQGSSYQLIQGTVSIHTSVPDVIKSKLYDPPLAGAQNDSYGKLYWSDENNTYYIGGNTHTRVLVGEKGKTKISSEIEKAIAQKGLFQGIGRGAADYVLDVWVIDAFRSTKGFTVSNEMFITSIWRLTKVKDSKVIICAFARGHGKWGGSFDKVIQDMVQNGLTILSDPSMPLTASEVAGDWPSMGAVIPEGFNRFKENWAKLQKGMTEENVRMILPSLPNRSGCINRYFTKQQCSSAPVVIRNFEKGISMYIPEPSGELQELFLNTLDKNTHVDTPSGWDTKTVILSYIPSKIEFYYDRNLNLSEATLYPPFNIGQIISVPEEIFEPLYPFYNVTFVNGSLDYWELKNK